MKAPTANFAMLKATSALGLMLSVGAPPALAQVGENVARLAGEVAQHGGRVIVGLRPAPGLRGMRAAGVRALDQSTQVAIAAQLEPLGLQVTRQFRLITALSGTVDTTFLERLLAHPNVEYVVPDYVLQLHDPKTDHSDTALRATLGAIPYGVAKIRADQAWAVTSPANYGGGVKVAILDSGGDFDHVDLLFAGGYDTETGSTAPSAWDDNVTACGGHGTHVSGIVAARRGNGVGYQGVAPEVSLYMVKVAQLTQINGAPVCPIFTSSVVAGLDWIVANGIQVVNMSIGGPHSIPQQDAVQAAAAAGVLMVSSAGNDNAQVNFPAAYPEVIAVAATDISDVRASFSNFGPELAVAAPGVSVPSTLPNNSYGIKNGTSMSSPHVAGVVALLLAHHPVLDRGRVRELLRDGAIDLGASGKDPFYGDGRVDALNSVNLLLTPPGTPAQLAITRQPSGAVSGGAFAVQPVVQLRDASNQPVGQAGVVVTAVVASGGGQLTGFVQADTDGDGRKQERPSLTGGTTAVTNASGIAVFADLTITGSGNHTLQFSAPSLPPVTSEVFDVAAAPVTPLQNGVPVAELSGAAGSVGYYVLTVPAGQSHLQFSISGVSGDADLYVRRGQVPTQTAWDCRPFRVGNAETCTFDSPVAGDWYVMLRGFLSYSGVTLLGVSDVGAQRSLALTGQPGGAISGRPLTAQPVVQLQDNNNQPLALSGVVVSVDLASGSGLLTGSVNSMRATTDADGVASFVGVTILGEGNHTLRFSAQDMVPILSAPFPVAPPTVTALENAVPVSGLADDVGSSAFYSILVPQGQTQLQVTTSGGLGNVLLLLQLGRTPDLNGSGFDCASDHPGNAEVCTVALPAAGVWYIMLGGQPAIPA
jgi:hypothetical protein